MDTITQHDDAPAPRLCHLIKWPDFDGYGFNLHAERSNPGQYIGKIDDDSPAHLAGLREGDRIVEVNGVNISNENHRQVVERIKSNPTETKLLVVDPETDQWFKEHDIVVKSTLVNVTYIKTPVPRPKADSPRAKFHQAKALNPLEEAQKVAASSASEQSAPSKATTDSISPTLVSSSLETSDYNDDSIEQQQRVASASPSKQQPASPPMSPDSGKGDEDASAGVVVEAEINRQSPTNLLASRPSSPAAATASGKTSLEPDSLNSSEDTEAGKTTDNEKQQVSRS